MSSKTFTCKICGQERDYDDLAKISNGGSVCRQCRHEDNPVEWLTEQELRDYLSIDVQLDEYLSFGKTYSKVEGEYVEHLSLWGHKVTDPRVIDLIREKYSILFPDKYD
jgi:hypothetical protein